MLLPKAVVPVTRGPVLQQRGGDQWQKAHPYTQRGFTPQRVRGSYQPEISPGEVLDRGLVIPAPPPLVYSVTLGTSCVSLGTPLTPVLQSPHRSPALGESRQLQTDMAVKITTAALDKLCCGITS